MMVTLAFNELMPWHEQWENVAILFLLLSVLKTIKSSYRNSRTGGKICH